MTDGYVTSLKKNTKDTSNIHEEFNKQYNTIIIE
jgi:hypothetical protein